MGVRLLASQPRALPLGRRKRKAVRALLGTVLGTVAAGLAVLLLCNGLVARRGTYCTDQLAALPTNEVGLVLGTSKFLPGRRPNAYYSQRIAAALMLYKAGKVQFLLVSGDNRSSRYNEPMTMKKDLVAGGVPKEKVFCDFAGFRTLDSVVRAKEVFGQSKLTVISQRFHNERAVYLARANGIDAVGFDAANRALTGRTLLRESLARVQAVLDVHVRHKRPKFLGERISIH